jgi:phage/plasmid-associated DNA primase
MMPLNPTGSYDELPSQFTEDEIAAGFSKQFKDELRYVAVWNRWFRYDGTVWREDTTLAVFDLIRHYCRTLRRKSNKEKERIMFGKATTVASIERLVRADRRHAAPVDLWDRDRFLLNTPQGVVDLRTGQMRKHSAEDYMTRVTAVGPAGECPLWLAFLYRVTGGDANLMAFLQRTVGYALTGSTKEHALWFFYGTGGNGKGVFLNTMASILSNYAAVAPMQTFTESKTSVTQRNWQCCVGYVSSRHKKLRRGGVGTRALSSLLLAVILWRRALCAKISSNISRNSSCYSPATTSLAFATLTPPRGAASTWFR